MNTLFSALAARIDGSLVDLDRVTARAAVMLEKALHYTPSIYAHRDCKN